MRATYPAHPIILKRNRAPWYHLSFGENMKYPRDKTASELRHVSSTGNMQYHHHHHHYHHLATKELGHCFVAPLGLKG
jgi:hypothetical protein